MKYIYSIFLFLLFVTGSFAQTSVKDFVGVPADSVGPVSLRTGRAEVPAVQQDKAGVVQPKAVAALQPHIPTARPIDKNKAVGEIAMTSSVTPNGAMTISVPIEIYRSPVGLDPQVSLDYNSLGGDGALGFGWSIGGLSCISRTNSTLYYDNKIGKTDRYSPLTLDGERLIRIGPNRPVTYGVPGDTVYIFKTEQSHVKVIGYCTPMQVFTKFRVLYPDGRRALYGGDNLGNFYFYPLMEVTDRQGNKIKYHYSFISGQYRPDKITYGHKQEGSIEFFYSARANEYNRYTDGNRFTCNYLLSTIRTMSNSEQLRRYDIRYADKDKSYVIDQIDCVSGGQSLNPLVFYYGEGNESNELKMDKFQLLTYYMDFEKPSQIRVAKGKINYYTQDDGLVMAPNMLHQVEYKRGNTQNYLVNQYVGDESIFVAADLERNVGSSSITLKTGAGFSEVFCMEANAAGGEEIVKINSTIVEGRELIDIQVYTLPDNTEIVHDYTLSIEFEPLLEGKGRPSINPKFYYPGDFNGDGKIELLVVTAANLMESGRSSGCFLVDLAGNQLTSYGNPFNYEVTLLRYGSEEIGGEEAYNRSDKLLALDYDGDGRTDLCHIGSDGIRFYTFMDDGTVRTAQNAQFTKADLIGRDLLPADMNNDGMPDLLISPAANGGSFWKVCLSQGDGTFQIKEYLITAKKSDSYFILQDMNGDGYPDLVEQSNSSKLTTWFFYAGLPTTSAMTTTSPESILVPINIQSRHSYSKLLSLNNTGIVSKIYCRRDAAIAKSVTGFVGSLGVVTKIDYAKLTTPGVYTPGSGAGFPYANYNGDLSVVRYIGTFDNSSTLSYNGYMYANAIVHWQGLGFRGFTKVMNNSYLTGDYTEQTYDPYKFGVPTRGVTKAGTIDYEYKMAVGFNKLTSITLIGKTARNEATGAVVTSAYEYDAYGNAVKETVDYGGGLSAVTTAQYLNVEQDMTYLIGLPTEQLVTKHRNGLSATTKDVFDYDANRQLRSKSSYVNNRKVAEELYIHDSYYFRTGLWTKAYSAPDWTVERYVYDDLRFVTSKTNALGLTEKYSYNKRGQQVATENHRGHVTTYEYDPWGRMIRTLHPDGSADENNYEWSPSVGLILLTKKEAGSPAQQLYTDVLGREVRSGTQCFDGNYLYTDKMYDSRQRPYMVSLPFKETPTQWNSCSYDYYDRLAGVEYASGRTDTYSYNGQSTTTVIDGQSSTRSCNAAGEVLSVHDPSGVIVNTYRADGQLSSVTTHEGITTLFEYDEYGRQIKLTDPSAGVKTFAYDRAGNISSETDANGRETTSVYDVWNRLISKNAGGQLTTAYTYNDDGLLLAQSSSNGTGISYTYDDLLRVAAVKEMGTDGRWFEKSYCYADGKTASIAYSASGDAIATEVYHYTYDVLSEIRLGTGHLVWRLDEVGELGLPSRVTTGDLTRDYTYDSFGQPAGRRVKHLTRLRQSVNYVFDTQTRNLQARQDNMHLQREEFGYDQMNRLTNFGGKAAAYDAKGNITYHSAIGQFGYGPDKPYAITMVTPYGNAIPLREQRITYNALSRPDTLVENGRVAILDYNSEGDRVKMLLRHNNAETLRRYYLGKQYELDSASVYSREKLYLGGNYYSAPAVYVKTDSTDWAVYYICRDYMGSITHLITSDGEVAQELSYDAWGQLRNPATHQAYAPGDEPDLFLGRGYTGHEHLTDFGLINMNARLYDPALGRFLSPDPYVQSPEMSQNFNRYSYCLNNPLRYKDENGEFIFTPITFIVDFFKTIFTGGWRDFDPTASWSLTNKAWRIDIGLFKTDSDKNFWGRAGEILSRFTWQSPQMLFGYLSAGFHNIAYGVKSVDHYGGATVIQSYGRGWGAFTLGSFVVGSRSIEAVPSNFLFQHEYGHYLQSQYSGLFYLTKYALPSILSAAEINTVSNHSLSPGEQDANIRAFQYFSKDSEGYEDWKSENNPIFGYNFSSSINSADNVLALQRAKLKLAWHEWATLPNYLTPHWRYGVLLNAGINVSQQNF